MSKTWIWVRLAQMGFDFCVIYAAFLLAYFWRVGWVFSTDFDFGVFATISFFAAGLWSGFLVLTKYYRLPIRSGKRAFFDFVLIFLGGVIGVSFLILAYFFNRELFFSRLINGYVIFFGGGGLILSQMLFRTILAHLRKNQAHVYRTLIIGANRVAERIIRSIENDRFAPHRVVGVIDPYGLEKNIGNLQISGKLDRLESICQQKKVSEIIQCDGFEHTINVISFCERAGIKYQFEPALRGIFEENLRVRDVAGYPMISFVQRDFSGAKKKWWKILDFLQRQIFDID